MPLRTQKTANPTKLLTCALLLAIVAGVFACVTVNVNFPESAVQEATDNYVRDLYEAKERGKPAPAHSASPGQPEAQAGSGQQSSIGLNWAQSLAENMGLIATAHADAVNGRLETVNPKTEEIKQRLRGRVSEIITQKHSGVLGEGNDGLLVIKNPQKLSPLLKKKIEKLVEDENSDRNDLYAEIMKINQMPSGRHDALTRSFARSFQAASPLGTWIQDESGAWTQKS